MKKRKIRRRPKPVEEKITLKMELSDKEFQSNLDELVSVKEQKKLLEAREKELKERISPFLEANGSKDSKGSKALIRVVNGQKKVVKLESRKSVSLDASKAEEFFREKNLWKEVTDARRVINEGYIEQALNNGKISEDELLSLTKVRESVAFVIRDYEEENKEE